MKLPNQGFAQGGWHSIQNCPVLWLRLRNLRKIHGPQVIYTATPGNMEKYSATILINIQWRFFFRVLFIRANDIAIHLTSSAIDSAFHKFPSFWIPNHPTSLSQLGSLVGVSSRLRKRWALRRPLKQLRTPRAHVLAVLLWPVDVVCKCIAYVKKGGTPSISTVFFINYTSFRFVWGLLVWHVMFLKNFSKGSGPLGYPAAYRGWYRVRQ